MNQHRYVHYKDRVERVEKKLETCLGYTKACEEAGITYEKYMYAKKKIKEIPTSTSVQKNKKNKKNEQNENTERVKIVKKDEKKGVNKNVKEHDTMKVSPKTDEIKLYNKAEKYRIDKKMSIRDACEKANITTAKYYKIKKSLNIESINKTKSEKKDNSKLKSKSKGSDKKITTQNGGNIDILSLLSNDSKLSSVLRKQSDTLSIGSKNRMKNTETVSIGSIKEDKKKPAYNNIPVMTDVIENDDTVEVATEKINKLISSVKKERSNRDNTLHKNMRN
jgi:hypothetical protein